MRFNVYKCKHLHLQSRLMSKKNLSTVHLQSSSNVYRLAISIIHASHESIQSESANGFRITMLLSTD